MRLVFHFFPVDFTLTVEFTFTLSIVEFSPGSLTVISIFSLTKSLKTLIISMLLSFFVVKFVKIIVLTWANVWYNRHRR